MRLKTDWIIQDPIDLEHKQYVFLDYASKVRNDLDKFKLYPSFQELALHLANTSKILEKGEYLSLGREPEEIDDEILIDDLTYHKIFLNDTNNFKEIISITKYAKEQFTELFLMSKAIWTLLYDSVTIRVVQNGENIKEKKPGAGFFYVVHNNKILIYQYLLRRIKKNMPENKCDIVLIYEGVYNDVDTFLDIVDIIKKHCNIDDDTDLTKSEKIDSVFPIFEVKCEQHFPLEGGILSIARRKVMNYVFQTIQIANLKDH
jgi:hypothetical protein